MPRPQPGEPRHLHVSWNPDDMVVVQGTTDVEKAQRAAALVCGDRTVTDPRLYSEDTMPMIVFRVLEKPEPKLDEAALAKRVHDDAVKAGRQHIGRRMVDVGETLAALLNECERFDAAAETLTGEEYPFHRELGELYHEVRAAACLLLYGDSDGSEQDLGDLSHCEECGQQIGFAEIDGVVGWYGEKGTNEVSRVCISTTTHGRFSQVLHRPKRGA